MISNKKQEKIKFNKGVEILNSPPEVEQELDDEYRQWYKLDNAATIFSLVTSPRNIFMFRLSVTLMHPVNITQLQQALDIIIERFPYYRVNLKKGLFWCFWSANWGKPRIIADSKYPCQEMPITKRGIFPFRIRAYRKRIAAEFHHSITDGYGGITFLKALVAEYLSLRGVKIKDWQNIFRSHQSPHPEEYEDAFKKNYKKIIPKPDSQIKAFHLPFKVIDIRKIRIITGITSVVELLKLSKKYDVTLTEFLTAVYIYALQETLFNLNLVIRKKYTRPIRVIVPVNLRKIYPSRTMRNFSLYVTPGIDPRLGKHKFNEIIKEVYHYMRAEVNEKYINKQINRNVRTELHPLLRVTPLFLKRIVSRLVYNRLGPSTFSGTLTNLGIVNMPDKMDKEIDNFQFIIVPDSNIKITTALVSYKEKLYINFARLIEETHVERYFFRKLIEMGISVKIKTN